MGERACERIVLIVDDEASIRGLFSRILAIGGYLPIAADCTEEALTLLDAGLRPDAVILDLKMPGMGGLALLMQLRARSQFRGIPTAIVTGDTFLSETTVNAAEALHAELHFKPMTMDELLELTGRLLAPKPLPGSNGTRGSIDSRP